MTAARIPLRIGPLAVDGYESHSSAIRWVVPDGHFCQPGEIIGWCKVQLVAPPSLLPKQHPFASEQAQVQVAFAPRVGGRLRCSTTANRGGWHDILPVYQRWNANDVIGHLEDPSSRAPDESQLRRLFAAGRLVMSEGYESPFELLGGWYDRRRAWWGAAGPGRPTTLLCLGTCEQQGMILGEQGSFRELFAAAAGPAQVVYVPDTSLVPAASIVLAGLQRTAVETARITEDAVQSFQAVAGAEAAPVGPGLDNWVFLHRVLAALSRSPLTDTYPVFGSDGVLSTGPADVVLLSLSSEARTILRHRKLGYPMWCHPWRLNQAQGPFRAWLRREFEPVRRTPDDIGRDLRTLIGAIQERTGALVLILNVVSTSASEDVYTYAGFDPPLADTLSSVRSKELNLMVQEVCRDRHAAVVDLDAVVADLGTAEHLPDGIHGSGLMQAAVRAEILATLQAAGVPGFHPA